MHNGVLSTSAAQAVDQLTADARALFTKLAEIVDSMQNSSKADADSTLQHLLLYNEAVTSLQVLEAVVSIATLREQFVH